MTVTSWRGDRGDGIGSPTVLEALRRKWLLALLVAAACSLLAALLAASRTPTATATASLLVQDPRGQSIFGDGGTDDKYVANQVAVLRLPAVQEAALELARQRRPGLALSPAGLREGLDVSNVEGTDLITLSFASPDPVLARDVVNDVATAYQRLMQQQAQAAREARLARLATAIDQVEAEVQQAGEAAGPSLRESYQTLLRQRAEVSVDAAAAESAGTFSAAALPTPSRPVSVPQAALLGAVLGLAPAAALSYLLVVSRRRFADRFDPEGLLGVPLLSEVPDFSSERLTSDVPVLDAGGSSAAEAFRFAATLIAVRQASDESVVHAVVSAGGGDGKSVVSANLAVTAAQAGRKVLAIDGDLVGRGLAFLLLGGQPQGMGLVDVLAGTAEFEDVVVRVELQDGAVVSVLRPGSGPDDPSRLMGLRRWQELLAALRADYDQIVIDSPPLLQMAYASNLVRAADAAVLVVPHASAVRRMEDLVDRVSVLGVPCLGYLYNRAPLRRELGQLSRRVEDPGRLAGTGRGDHRGTDAFPRAAASAESPSVPSEPVAPGRARTVRHMSRRHPAAAANEQTAPDPPGDGGPTTSSPYWRSTSPAGNDPEREPRRVLSAESGPAVPPDGVEAVVADAGSPPESGPFLSRPTGQRGVRAPDRHQDSHADPSANRDGH